MRHRPAQGQCALTTHSSRLTCLAWPCGCNQRSSSRLPRAVARQLNPEVSPLAPAEVKLASADVRHERQPKPLADVGDGPIPAARRREHILRIAASAQRGQMRNADHVKGEVVCRIAQPPLHAPRQRVGLRRIECGIAPQRVVIVATLIDALTQGVYRSNRVRRVACPSRRLMLWAAGMPQADRGRTPAASPG
jgi:hypothetical protein